MVDQALSLRPEERRPLFEEVAGVRRHERRRRKAEEQLVESESNLSRVEDILAELRPQVRRLAAQAEQQASRSTIGEELTAALLLNAHARWNEVSTRASEATARGERARSEVDAAMADLTEAEGVASAVADALSARARVEAERREGHDLARAALTALQLSDGRLTSELEAIGRDRTRLASERDGAEADAVRQRRALAAPIPSRDADLERAVGEAERALAEALAELGTLRAATQAKGEELAAVRRAEAVRTAELETARRRLAESERQHTQERAQAAASAERRDALEAALAEARSALAVAIEAERVAVEARERARETVESSEALRAGAADRAARLNSMAATARGRLQSLEARIAEDEARGIARAAKRHGGRRVDDDLVVEPAFRAAVEAALAGATRAYVVAAAAVTDLGAERGLVVVEERTGAGPGPADARERRFRDALATAGGGILADAVGRDGAGVARRLLAHAAWLPDLAACLAIQSDLPSGWIVVPRDGSAVVGDLTVSLGAADPILERRAEVTSVAADVSRLDAEAATAAAESETATETATTARAALEDARQTESAATTARRRAEETERAAARDLELVAREAAWHRRAGRAARPAKSPGIARPSRPGRLPRATGSPRRPARATPRTVRHSRCGSRVPPNCERPAIDWPASWASSTPPAAMPRTCAPGPRPASRWGRNVRPGRRANSMPLMNGKPGSARSATASGRTWPPRPTRSRPPGPRSGTSSRPISRTATGSGRPNGRRARRANVSAQPMSGPAPPSGPSWRPAWARTPCVNRSRRTRRDRRRRDPWSGGRRRTGSGRPDRILGRSHFGGDGGAPGRPRRRDRRVGRRASGRASARAGPARPAPPPVPRARRRRPERARGSRRAQRATRRRSKRRARTCGPRSQRRASSSPSWTRSSPTSSGRRSPRWRRRSRPVSSSCSAAGTRSCR